MILKKIILFGSRARGTNDKRSDIDLAVVGGNPLDFHYDISEYAHTLLMFDVIDLNDKITEELKQEIEKDGITIYEKT
ncbi:MAG: nucleotidyltransferase domain-containing protein [Firmicutes bacterium]|nr:nucleotidyltransferase domain-containing protein [Bacillota bacterium]